jgi:hypothetical protein
MVGASAPSKPSNVRQASTIRKIFSSRFKRISSRKEARRRQRRHIGSAGREERPATDEGTLDHGVKDHVKAIQAGHKVRAFIVNDVIGPERLDKCNVAGPQAALVFAPSALAI